MIPITQFFRKVKESRYPPDVDDEFDKTPELLKQRQLDAEVKRRLKHQRQLDQRNEQRRKLTESKREAAKLQEPDHLHHFCD